MALCARPHVDVEIALVRGALDVLSRSSSSGRRCGELAQTAQRHLDVARAELDLIVEVLELASIPDLHGAAVLALAADTDAFGIVTALPNGEVPPVPIHLLPP